MTHENYESNIPPAFLEWLQSCIGKGLRMSYFDLPKRNFSIVRGEHDLHLIAGACYFNTSDESHQKPFRSRRFFRVAVVQKGFLGLDYLYDWSVVQLEKNLYENPEEDHGERFRTVWAGISIGKPSKLKEVRIYGYQFDKVLYPQPEVDEDPESVEYESCISAYLERFLVLIYEDGTTMILFGANHDPVAGELVIEISSKPNQQIDDNPFAPCGLVFQEAVCLKVLK